MAPERDVTAEPQKQDEISESSGELDNSPSKMADKLAIKQEDLATISEQILPPETEDKMLDNILLETIINSNSARTESTATDDSGIAAEFDYQSLLDEDNESVLGNSQNNSLKSSTSSCSTTHINLDSLDNLESPRNSPTKTMKLELSGHLGRTPERRRLSSEDDCTSPRQRWWSPHRAVCSESLDSIAEEKRRRSKGDITKRTAWLKERTETALEKSALVRKRSARLIQTGKRLRNEEL